MSALITGRNRLHKITHGLLPFFLTPFPIDTLLIGMKTINKKKQRVGQQRVDEDFKAVRKFQFPSAPSIFTLLWVTNDSSARSRTLITEFWAENQPGA
jgi:hypothetical protein